MFALTGAGMNNEPGRFVDHNQIFVFIKDIERNRFGSSLDFFRRRLIDDDAIARAYRIARSGRGFIYRHEFFPNQLLKTRPRKLCQLAREKLIEAQPRRLFGRNQFDSFRLV